MGIGILPSDNAVPLVYICSAYPETMPVCHGIAHIDLDMGEIIVLMLLKIGRYVESS